VVTFFIKTYGCLANVADSEGLARYLIDLGCAQVSQASEADLIMVNTCAIRDKAESKLYSYLGQFAPLKKQKPYIKIGIIGCVASYRKKELYQSFDHLSFVYGARDEMPVLQSYLVDAIEKIAVLKQLFFQDPDGDLGGKNGQDRDVKELVAKRNISKFLGGSPRGNALEEFLMEAVPSSTSPEKEQSLNISEYNLKKHIQDGMKKAQNNASPEVKRSYINIMTGCNKYCSYCIVPFTRGREISYPMKDIISAVIKDIEMGSREVTLIGQNVNSYIDPETEARFPELLKQVAQIPGEFWIRFISPHPQDMTHDLFDVMAQYRPKITAALHFPLQSGSNRILQLMNRNYTSQEFLEKIGWIREKLPGAAISTDIIVGFPGETEAEFLETMAVVEQVRFDLIYPFIYSSRPNTKASLIADNCLLVEKTRRLEFLRKRQIEIAVQCNSAHIGKNLKVLVEKRLARGKLLSRTEGNLRVLVDGSDDLIGQFVTVHIKETGPANMIGILVS